MVLTRNFEQSSLILFFCVSPHRETWRLFTERKAAKSLHESETKLYIGNKQLRHMTHQGKETVLRHFYNCDIHHRKKEGYGVNILDTKMSHVQVNSKQRNSALIVAVTT